MKWNLYAGAGAAEFSCLDDMSISDGEKITEIFFALDCDIFPGYVFQWKEIYNYDANGNRISKSNGWGTIYYQYDNATRHYTYDANGNCISESLGGRLELAKYAYDAQNQLTGAEIADYAEAIPTYYGEEYSYDPFGRVNRKAVKTGASLAALNYNNGAACNYDGFGFNALSEFAVDPGSEVYTLAQDNTWAENNILASTVYNNAAGSGRVHYTHDQLGSVLLAHNMSSDTYACYHYDAFGNNYSSTTNNNAYLFAGKSFNSRTRLLNFGYRNYNPLLGRFTSIDPIRDGGNWYAYCGNDPVNYVDWLGLCGEEKTVNFGLPDIKQLNIIPSIPRLRYNGTGWDWSNAVVNGLVYVPNGVATLTNTLLTNIAFKKKNLELLISYRLTLRVMK